MLSKIMLHKVASWLGSVVVAMGAATFLCGADAPGGWVRIYSPVFVVNAVIKDAKVEQIFHEIVDSIRQTAILDMDDPNTAYDVRQFGHEEEMRYRLGYQYINSKSVKIRTVLARPSRTYDGPPTILISIGYGKEPIARDQLEAKADELMQELRTLCDRAGTACDVYTKPVPLLLGSFQTSR